MVVLPAPGGSAAKANEAPRSRPSQKAAASRGGMVPAWRTWVIESGSGWSQPCPPHQLSGWLTARMVAVIIPYAIRAGLPAGRTELKLCPYSVGRGSAGGAMMTTMRAAVVAGPQRFEIKEIDVPDVQPG